MAAGPSQLNHNFNQSDYNFREAHNTMVAFLKIIERFPELYSGGIVHVFRSRSHMDFVWNNVLNAVRTELNLDCTVEELKSKWRVIRMSFIRYHDKYAKSLLYGTEPPKRYYLADALEFLVPYLKEKGIQPNGQLERPTCTVDDGDSEDMEAILPNWSKVTDVDIIQTEELAEDDCRTSFVESRAEEPAPKRSKKTDDNDVNEDLQFFKKIDEKDIHYNSWIFRQKIIAFVKIIERHPVIYSTTIPDANRTKSHIDSAWTQVHKEVTAELGLNCTVKDLRVKWKGILQSFCAYISKLHTSKRKGTEDPAKYYLSDALNFLTPCQDLGLSEEKLSELIIATTTSGKKDDNPSTDHTFNLTDTTEVELIKPESEESDEEISVVETNLEPQRSETILLQNSGLIQEPISSTSVDTNIESQRNTNKEDLQFFKCILPDITHFTIQEKRRLKIGVLQLIDDIENERQNCK